MKQIASIVLALPLAGCMHGGQIAALVPTEAGEAPASIAVSAGPSGQVAEGPAPAMASSSPPVPAEQAAVYSFGGYKP